MRFIQYLSAGRIAWARLEGEEVVELSAAPWNPKVQDVQRLPLDPKTSLLAPCEPSKIVCVGKNYRAHISELHPGEDLPTEPLIFLKPTSALLPPGLPILMPAESQRVDYEGELALVIGKCLSRPSREEAQAGIFGYTIANDVTARDLQKKDGQWTRGKGFDTFCPVGPWLSTEDPGDAILTTRLNKEIRQQASLKQMIFSPVDIIHYVANIMTLYPGDVILTGTPEGVGPMKSGDLVEIEIGGLGVLRNTTEAR